jgi:hypothetical protein
VPIELKPMISRREIVPSEADLAIRKSWVVQLGLVAAFLASMLMVAVVLVAASPSPEPDGPRPIPTTSPSARGSSNPK